MKTARLVPPLLLTSAFGLGVLAGACTTREANLDHCSNNEGDRYCAQLSPETPFCSNGSDAACNGTFPTGCVAAEDLLEGCADPCGSLSAEECDGLAGGSSSGTSDGSGEPGTDSVSATEGATGSTTGGLPACDGPEDCGGDTPFCSELGECVSCSELADGDGACSDADAATPVCSEGVCVQCTDENAGACVDATPTCGSDNECVACTEHAHCPESACHLDGPDVGRCFDVGAVQMIADGTALTEAFDNAPDGGDLVLVLTGTISDYGNTSISFATSAEVAVIGDGSQLLTNDDLNPIVASGGESIVYFGGVSIGGNILGDGLACSGTSVWLDDSEVRSNDGVGLTVSGGCAAHLRRSVISDNDGGGMDASGATTRVLVETSVIASNGNGAGRGLVFDDAQIEMTFSTVVRNDGTSDDTLLCIGTAGGVIRNSILAGRDAPSISGACSNVMFSSNRTDTDVGGADNVSTDVPNEEDWFVAFFRGDYHLSAQGQDELDGIAMWQEGDPATDIDGEPVSTDSPSFPGYDQPSP